jgi:hypothetical protein
MIPAESFKLDLSDSSKPAAQNAACWACSAIPALLGWN